MNPNVIIININYAEKAQVHDVIHYIIKLYCHSPVLFICMYIIVIHIIYICMCNPWLTTCPRTVALPMRGTSGKRENTSNT